MRLTEWQAEAILQSIRETFGSEAKTYLFGSRTDDTKFGGDIDLLVEVDHLGPEAFSTKLRALGSIQRRIGEQKIDLVVTDGSAEIEGQLIVQNARKVGLPL